MEDVADEPDYPEEVAPDAGLPQPDSPGAMAAAIPEPEAEDIELPPAFGSKELVVVAWSHAREQKQLQENVTSSRSHPTFHHKQQQTQH